MRPVESMTLLLADYYGQKAERLRRAARGYVDDRLREVESNLISWALKVSSGNKSKAAELLSIKRSTLGDRIKKLDLGHLEAGEN